MKIITYYLPQFHEIEENNDWWGKGYTEWTTLKKAQKLFKNHRQPRVPLHNNYYDLTNVAVLEWQANLARSYGIYGFCIYHYWFEGKLLLQKPLELLLNHKQIEIPYCISWANEDWTDGWVSNKPNILQKQTYGARDDWKNHFLYFLPYFQDERYIKINGKPLLIIYHPEEIPYLHDMLSYWQELAVQYHLSGLCIASQHPNALGAPNCTASPNIDYQIEYQPDIARLYTGSRAYYFFNYCNCLLDKIFRTEFFSERKFIRPLIKNDYKKTWEYIIHMHPQKSNRIPGAFVDWDNTPRKGKRGSVFIGTSSKLFCHYLKKQIENTRNIYKQDYLFLFAWNEWSEGGYLEPDTETEYLYLNAVMRALKETNEWENE